MNRIRQMEQSELKPRRLLAWRPALAAAVVLIAACAIFLSVNSRGGSGTAKAALDDAIKATRAVRFIHIKSEPAPRGSLSDIWAQFDDQGNLIRMRMDFPDTEDGPKVVLWQADLAQVWFLKKNSFVTVREPEILKKLKMSATDFDPRYQLERLQRMQAEGKISIQTGGSMKRVEPITLQVTYKDNPNRRADYMIDIPTSLVRSMEKFELRGGKWISVGKLSFLDYNDPKVARAFEVNPPAGVIRVDQAAQQVGLAQGDLSKEEIAKKVAREYFEAMIAEDYAKAGQLLEGVPADYIKANLKGIRFLRIVEIGEPQPHRNPQTGGVQVECKVEIEENGKKFVKTFKPGIRPVYNQPDRWDIFGGI